MLGTDSWLAEVILSPETITLRKQVSQFVASRINFNVKYFLLIIIFFSVFSFGQTNFGWDTGYLDVVTFRNGDSLNFAQTKEEWADASEKGIPSYCFYENSESSGILYNWFAVIDSRGLAPYGWRIPNQRDFSKLQDLEKYYNQSIIDLLSSKFINGYRAFDGGYFYSKDEVSYYWSSSEVNGSVLEAQSFTTILNDGPSYKSKNRKEDGLSIVCIRNYDEDISKKGGRSIQASKEICKGDSVNFRVVGGDVSSDAIWVWYEK